MSKGFLTTNDAGDVHLYASVLPDSDRLGGLNYGAGTYSLERWPAEVGEQIKFLQQIMSKYGGEARVRLIMPDDGYPGYIQVG